MVRPGVDVGGTFTDLVAVAADGVPWFAKVPSSVAIPPRRSWDAVAEAALCGEDVVRFAHGATVAKDALLESRGAVTALLTGDDFGDVIEIGAADRPAL